MTKTVATQKHLKIKALNHDSSKQMTRKQKCGQVSHIENYYNIKNCTDRFLVFHKVDGWLSSVLRQCVCLNLLLMLTNYSKQATEVTIIQTAQV